MYFSCCTAFDNYDSLVKHGYDRIILPAAELMQLNDAQTAHVQSALADGPVKCRALNSFCAPSLKLCGEGYDCAAVESYSAVLAERASILGVQYIGVGAPKSRSIPDGFNRSVAMTQFAQSLKILCGISASYQITVLLEAVCSLECNFITKTDEALEVVQALNYDNLALVYDTYHAFMMGEDAAPLCSAMNVVKLVHVAQNIDNRRHYLRRENTPEYRVFFDALLGGGYDGEVSVEAFYDDIEAQLDETLSIMKLLSRH